MEMAHGYNVVLANPGAMQQYSGLKHTDDKTDAFFIAELLRLNILPTGHIYPIETRSIRDLLRRRQTFVQSTNNTYFECQVSYHANLCCFN